MKTKDYFNVFDGDCFIYTDKGYVKLNELVDKTVNVFDGKGFSEVLIKNNNHPTEFKRIRTTNVLKNMECAGDCILHIKNNNPKFKDVRVKYTDKNSKIIKIELPKILTGDKKLEYPYEAGYFAGQKIGTDNNNIFSVNYYKKGMIKKFKLFDSDTWKKHANSYVNSTYSQFKKKFVPSSEYSIEDRISYVSGFLDAKASIAKYESNKGAYMYVSDLNFLTKLNNLFSSLGISLGISKIYMNNIPMYRMSISFCGITELIKLGMNSFKFDKSNDISVDSKPYDWILNIENIGDKYGCKIISKKYIECIINGIRFEINENEE